MVNNKTHNGETTDHNTSQLVLKIIKSGFFFTIGMIRCLRQYCNCTTMYNYIKYHKKNKYNFHFWKEGCSFD